MAEDRVEESNQEVKNPTPGQSVQDKPLQSRRVAPSTRGAASRAQKKYWMLVAGAVLAVAYAGNEFTPMMVFYRGENVFGSVFVDALLACYAAGIAAGLLLCGPLSDRYGRRIVMLPAPVISLVGSILIAVGEMNEPLIFTGRLLSGFAVGMVMTAGGAWIKELSTPAFDPSANAGSGARRATMSLTLGFAVGAAFAGVLAEWGPAPGQTPYIISIVLCALSMVGIMGVPETRQNAHLKVKGSFWSDLNVPSLRHPRFLTAVVPIAPWVFGCAGVAYAIMPSLAQDQVPYPIAFSAGITAVALAFGFGIQQVSSKYINPNNSQAQQLGLVLVIVGMIVAAWTAHVGSLVGTIAVGLILGTGYGVCLIAGLTEVQRIASADDLGGLTAFFYTITYIGFFFPMILSRLKDVFTYTQMLGFGAVVALIGLIVVTLTSKKFIPTPEQQRN
ncbi:MFS transporter [uncultured Corynebacterium sp.]|uniref:MFS transporter n=2 Tax=Corynebacterium TaxID=1716 RepID=UPI0025E82789|nr:MFS transporter [uncultured Corynebacterium sp.]